MQSTVTQPLRPNDFIGFHLTEHFVEGWPSRAAQWVYEVWNVRGELAYVGMTDKWERRWAQHVEKSWWLRETEIQYIYLLGFAQRWEAAAIEADAIHWLNPIYNTVKADPTYRRYRRYQTDTQDIVWPVARRWFKAERETA